MLQRAVSKKGWHAQTGALWSVPRAKRPRIRSRGGAVQVQALRIDRRLHLELAWDRQEEEDRQLEAQVATSLRGAVLEVRDLRQLELLLEKAGNSIVVVFFYSKSCGACKEISHKFSRLCTQSEREGADVVFLKHNVHNDFDSLTDVIRMYKVRTVPSFGFFAGGALVRCVRMRDIRGLAGPHDKIRAALDSDQKKLASTLREMLFRFAPSGMR